MVKFTAQWMSSSYSQDFIGHLEKPLAAVRPDGRGPAGGVCQAPGVAARQPVAEVELQIGDELHVVGRADAVDRSAAGDLAAWQVLEAAKTVLLEDFADCRQQRGAYVGLREAFGRMDEQRPAIVGLPGVLAAV